MARLAILNVKYSSNLGDGIIAECLEHEITRRRPDWEVVSVDLAGREDFGTGLDAKRGLALQVLDAMPRPFRRLAVTFLLSVLIRARYRRVWRRKLACADAAIVGGGQLFGDADLNFPLKLRACLREVRKVPRPVAIFGVGVAKELSRTAIQLFADALKRSDLGFVAVRDAASGSDWQKHFGRRGVMPAGRCRDPGLLAMDVYPHGEFRSPRERTLVGLGIVNPRTLGRHSSEEASVELQRMRKRWSALAVELLDQGYDVSFFTNGPQDDEDFLQSVLDEIDNPRVRRSPRPLVPAQLAAIIRTFDVVVAHRLHANILAYAFRIPHVGLAWSPKIQAFFNSVDRGHFVADLEESRTESICDLIARTDAEGIDVNAHARVVEETREAVEECVDALAKALGQHTLGELEVQNAVGA